MILKIFYFDRTEFFEGILKIALYKYHNHDICIYFITKIKYSDSLGTPTKYKRYKTNLLFTE